MTYQWRWFYRKRLCWRELITKNPIGRDWAFFYFKIRFTGISMKCIDHAGFTQLNDNRYFALFCSHVHQHRMGRQVPVPNIVVNRLVMPSQFTCRCFYSQYGIGISIVSRSQGTIKIRSSACRRYKN